MQATESLRDLIIHALQHLEHVLPGQAPLKEFVHHNTLHGFQHLPFEEALAQFEALTGIQGYLPEARYREFYRQGRITDHDITRALANAPTLQANAMVWTLNAQVFTRKHLYKLALLADFTALTPHQLQWHMQEQQALNLVQADVPTSVKQSLLAQQPESQAITALWQTLLNKLDLTHAALHPETLLDFAQEQAETWLGDLHAETYVAPPTPIDTGQAINTLFMQVGTHLSLRGLLMALTGVDVLEQVRPQLIRLCASLMDEGVAPWTLPERQAGLYAAWRNSAVLDAHLTLHDLPDAQTLIATLPDNAVDAIIEQLTYLELPQKTWANYLERLALELPGWSGLINWRQHRPAYAANVHAPVALADYLAIRLTLDRLYLNQLCATTWKTPAKLGSLRKYFDLHPAEFSVRQGLYQGKLPEYLAQRAEQLITQAQNDWQLQPNWAQLSDLIHTWQHSPIAAPQTELTVYNGGWRLFRLLQHVGLNAEAIKPLSKQDLLHLLTLLDDFNATERAKIWLVAYENHYRDALFHGLSQNHSRGRWAKRDTRPAAQIILCMDEREESFRRHLEELNPAIETLGAAGFFGVPINYKKLDSHHAVPLCPVNVTPINTVNEVPKTNQQTALSAYQNKKRYSKWFSYLLYQNSRRNLLSPYLTINLLAPFALMSLLVKTISPKLHDSIADRVHQLNKPPATQLQFTSDEATNATLEQPKIGFNDIEQAQRVAALLRTIGLTKGFAPIVALAGHGSTSQNNPHEAAHDCGACGGRQGGANARVFAAMANRAEVRQLLAAQGLMIPEDCWFVGMQHDTCSDNISWYDLDVIPAHSSQMFASFKTTVIQALALSAHERCRRFFSVKKPITPANAFRQVQLRSQDLSQVRPEFGHATNAAAVIGRRALTQGLFLDRRVFLISYDPTEDIDGKIVENILLVAGPVGGGINLEYYFSTINNERFGCGTKIPHNITGLFGVMEGTSSDLRTGLPLQMVEIHEAMRLQIVVEAKTTVLERIYAEQDSLRELIAGGWVHLSAKDPDTGDISVFERGVGFVPWQAADQKLPMYANSPDCYAGQSLPIDPALIVQPNAEFLLMLNA